MNTPTISVIMSIYNEPVDWLNEAVNSILKQTFSDFEFIIINDHPGRAENERLLDELQRRDSRVIVITNKTNLGLTRSLNIGLNAAKGKYIARMDADDISEPNRFRLQHDFMENNADYIIVGCNVLLFSDNRVIKKIYYPQSDSFIKVRLIYRSAISHPAAFIRASAIKENKVYYNEGIKYAQDLALWCDLAKYGKYYNLSEFLVRYRFSENQISTAKFGEQSKLSYHVRKNYYNNIFHSLTLEKGPYSILANGGEVLFKEQISVPHLVKMFLRFRPIAFYQYYYDIIKRILHLKEYSFVYGRKAN